jgi:hydroxymethylglutaryl-CoA synthase
MYPKHGGRFTGEPAYFRHVLSAGRAIMEQAGVTANDFAYAVFHMPNGKFPLKAGKTLGFKKEQMQPGWIVPWMGNTYSGSSPTGLAATLDVAQPGDRILHVSFGSGAGSDAFIFKVTDKIEDVRKKAPSFRSMLDGHKMYLTYGQYTKHYHKIQLND